MPPPEPEEPSPKRRRGRPATGRDPLVSLRLPREALEAVEGIAKDEGVARSEVIRRAVLDWLARRG
ncbi:ribbon-helix-helix protein, CopG family [Salinarimonas sp.]|uniref:ribbon-helix-helix protein, CopG family n=1 Tax=Salinarimonas sp. TaxID=2766526 RepID=UPI0032D955AD